MSRRSKRNTTLFSFAALLFALPVWWGSGYFPAFVAAAVPQGEPGVPEGFPVTLLRAGLSADALAAAGVGSNAVAGALQAVTSEISEAPTALAAADATYASVRIEADRLERLIQSGTASTEEVAAYPAAKTALANATAARQAILDGYFDAGAATLTSPQRAALTKIRANRSWELPLEFLVVNREEAEWVSVRDCLANERIALELPDSLSQTAVSNLATWRANGSVAAAKTGLDSNLAAVTAAWNTASGN